MKFIATEYPDYDFIDGKVYRAAKCRSGPKRVGEVKPVEVTGNFYYRLVHYTGKRKSIPVNKIFQAHKEQITYCNFEHLHPLPAFPDYATDRIDIFRVSGVNRKILKPKLIKPAFRGGRQQYNLRDYKGVFRWTDRSMILA